MSEFHKSTKDCKNFEFNIRTRTDVERVLKHFENQDYQPLPKDLLVKAE